MDLAINLWHFHHRTVYTSVIVCKLVRLLCRIKWENCTLIVTTWSRFEYASAEVMRLCSIFSFKAISNSFVELNMKTRPEIVGRRRSRYEKVSVTFHISSPILYRSRVSSHQSENNANAFYMMISQEKKYWKFIYAELVIYTVSIAGYTDFHPSTFSPKQFRFLPKQIRFSP